MKCEHPSGISAECIAASTYDGHHTLYTLVVRAPKFLDAELRTHRMLSQNSSSSRAIPCSKVIEQAETNPFIPPEWRKNQKGMQGYESAAETPEDLMVYESDWLTARDNAVAIAKRPNACGIHKQHVNRLLEPFTWQWKVITATEWKNFFDLRLAENAQPEIQILARLMLDAIRGDVPRLIADEWHLPFITQDEADSYPTNENILISAARCARISYANHGTGKIDRDADLDLADLLMREKHLTPFEHQAKRLTPNQESHVDVNEQCWSGNFRGWLQHRKLIEAKAL